MGSLLTVVVSLVEQRSRVLRLNSLVVLRHGESFPKAFGPGIQPASPALAGRFLTTGPTRKSCDEFYN